MGSANSKHKQPTTQLSTTSDSSTNPPPPPPPPPPQVSAPTMDAALAQDEPDADDPAISAPAGVQPNNRASLIPGKKDVQVLKFNTPENYEDDTNQTGQSIYELKIQDSYFSTPFRQRSRAVTQAMEAERVKKAARAEKKAEKVAKKKSKSRADPQDILPGTVPWVIENAKRLGVLNLSKMALESVPDVTFESVPGTTRVINVSSNKMTQLDGRLCDYVLVQRLIANDNRLTAIPNKIARMTALKKLDLSTNILTALPDAFQTMRLLSHVDVSSNQLTELPTSFLQLDLKVLNLSHNKFSKVPVEIAKMEALEEFDISHNQISVIPQEYASLKNLRIFILDSNNLSDFPDVMFVVCLHLVKILIRGNPLKMSTLEAKEAYRDFAERRRIKCKRLLQLGTLTLDELTPADS